MKKTKIGISLRIMNASNYDEHRDALSHDWVVFFEKLNFIPILIPNKITNIPEFLDEVNVDGLILSGGDNIGDFPERDYVEKSILDYGIKKKLPIFGVCRGMQIINNYFGGTVITTSDQKHVDKSHDVNIINSFKHKILESKSIKVNSFHNNIINSNVLGKDLEPFALSADDTIEGFFHKSLPIVGVMWHPERSQNEINQEILRKVFHSTNL
jgi:putative glutamine amidotransferase